MPVSRLEFPDTGKLRGVPWPEGYDDDMRDPKYNIAQVRGSNPIWRFYFATLNMDALPLIEHLGSDRKHHR